MKTTLRILNAIGWLCVAASMMLDVAQWAKPEWFREGTIVAIKKADAR